MRARSQIVLFTAVEQRTESRIFMASFTQSDAASCVATVSPT